MDKNKLMNLYTNLEVIITDETERNDFKIICEKAIEERTHGDMFFFASVMYAYGKTVGIRKECEVERNGKLEAIHN